MSEPVDLTALRDLTDGDEELEKELFDSFYSVSENIIEALNNLTDSNDNKEWERNSHSFKGAAMNLGANSLAEKCGKSEEICTEGKQKKKEVLESIVIEYKKVKKNLEGIY